MLLENKKILWSHKSDISLFWVHNLTQKKVLIYDSENYEIYYSEIFDMYFFYFKSNDDDIDSIINNINELSNSSNNVHVVVCDFRCVDKLITLLDNKIDIKYSILNHMGEMVYDNNPRFIRELKNLKYYFTCSDLFDSQNKISDLQKTNKFILDYKYSFLYFYFKLGFNFLQKGEHIFKNENPENKIFLYTKSKNNSQRNHLIQMALMSEKLKTKEFNQEDEFWFNINNKTHHISFVIDYSICKFNLVMETQPLTKEKNILSRFITEKTIKSLLTPTPSYIVMQSEVYEDLSNYGFYFLNKEFGEYNFKNYEMFCEFLKNCNEESFDTLYQKSKINSINNKIKLEEYIFSDKTKEINLLWN
jgi:hypothetical protein